MPKTAKPARKPRTVPVAVSPAPAHVPSFGPRSPYTRTVGGN